MDINKKMDEIDDAKKRGAVNDLSAIAYQLAVELTKLTEKKRVDEK